VRTRVQKGEYAGTAIAWPRRCIPFHLNERGSDNAALGPIETAVRRSFAAWEQVDCSDTELTFQGLTNVELVGFTPNAKNINMVVFQEESWPHESKIIALTTVTYCSAPSGAPCDDAGRVLDADIEMNGVDFDFTVTPVPGLVRYDVQNTVTHEVGPLSRARPHLGGGRNDVRLRAGGGSARNSRSPTMTLRGFATSRRT
jgi:hypothetical protein